MIAILLLISQLHAAPVCDYTGNKFKVKVDGKTYERLVAPGFIEPAMVCADEIATLYDGYDWVVFRVAEKDFQVEKTNSNYLGAQLKVQGRLAGFYDGASLMMFDGERIHKFPVNPNYYRSQLVVSEKIVGLYDGADVHFVEAGRKKRSYAANPRYAYPEGVTFQDLSFLYDGDQLFVCDAVTGEIQHETMAPRSIFFEAAVGKNRALIYDGAHLFTYCSGKGFNKAQELPLAFVSSGYDAAADTLWMYVQGKRYELKATCQLAS